MHPSLPAIAIVHADTLAALGLSEILRRMMPQAEVRCYAGYEALAQAGDAPHFFHYFVSARELLAGVSFFLRHQRQTIVLVHGAEAATLPDGFHTLNVCQDEGALVRSILSLAHHAHNAHGAEPEAVRRARSGSDEAAEKAPRLTPRETEVLQGIVGGLINKEIAERMGVSLATVITHRKHLTEKLGTRSVSALTIYAITRGLAPCP